MIVYMPKQATFIIDNVFTRIQSDEAAYRKLDDAFSYWVQSAERTNEYKSGRWDGMKRLFTKLNKFPTGLLPEAKALLADYSIAEIDQRVRPDHDVKSWNLRGAEEREHQAEAYVAAIEEGRGIIWHATGAGKTEVMAAVIQMLDLPALVLCHQKSLAEQTRDRIQKRLGVRVGLYSSGKRQDAKIVVATFQTLQSQYKKDKKVLRRWLDQFQVMCIDEAQHSAARTYWNVICECNAYYRFAFSATPFKS